MLTTAALTNQYQRHFSKKLIQHAIQALIMHQFAQEGDLPKKSGVKSVRYYRREVATRDKVVELTEGTTPTEIREVNLVPVDVDLVQIGERAVVTDIVDMTNLFNMLAMHIEAMGEDCALDADSRVTETIVPAITSAGQKRFSGGAADFTALAALSAEAGKFTARDGILANTQLRVNRAPKIGGAYVAVVSPQISQDLQQTDRWIDASKYAASKQLLTGEIGMLDGNRYVEHTNPFIEGAVENTWDAEGDIFTTLFLGKGAYGVPKLSGTQSPVRPKVMIVAPNTPSDSDPLGQRGHAGWKAYWNASLLAEDFIVAVRSKSTFTV